MIRTYELKTKYDARASFGGKGTVEEDGKTKSLYSYNTLVAKVENGKVEVYNTQSATTIRHIKEFLKQEGYEAENKKQIIELYVNT